MSTSFTITLAGHTISDTHDGYPDAVLQFICDEFRGKHGADLKAAVLDCLDMDIGYGMTHVTNWGSAADFEYWYRDDDDTVQIKYDDQVVFDGSFDDAVKWAETWEEQ